MVKYGKPIFGKRLIAIDEVDKIPNTIAMIIAKVIVTGFLKILFKKFIIKPLTYLYLIL